MRRARDIILAFCIVIAMAALSAVLPALMAAHERPLRAAITVPDPIGVWHLSHVFSPGCPCSAAVRQHLIQRGVLPGVRETAYFVTTDLNPADPDAPQLAAKGFEVKFINPAAAQATLGVNGGPFLLIDRPNGTRAYAGGYGIGRPPTDSGSNFYQDQAILQALRDSKSVRVLPAFGCSIANSPRQLWQQLVLDPLSER